MSLIYVDTSALAKWYLPEANSEAFASWIQGQTQTSISSLTVTEFRCLLARRQRMKLLNASQAQELYANFQQDIQDGHLIRFEVSDRLVINAAVMIESLPTVALRTLDALHLTIARDIGAAILATADAVMAEAAARLDLEVVRFD